LAFWIDKYSNKHLVIDADELNANVKDYINVNSNGSINVSGGSINVASKGKIKI
jgi:hypothetical protein